MSSRTSALREIMQIENELKQIRRDPLYRKLGRNLGVLRNIRYSGGLVMVNNPEDLSKTVQVRRNSEEFNVIIEKYMMQIQPYETRLQVLNERCASLKGSLFG